MFRLPTNIVATLLLVSGALLLTACREDAAQQGDKSADSTADGGAWFQVGAAIDGGDTPVMRSPADPRAYRYLRLSNGLKVLLIADPQSDKAAASLNVNVGSVHNPLDRQGLAHFLEHMLFLGTDRYPEAGAYQAFVSEHGGQHNAYTSTDDTNYFFDIDADYLDAALDRFSRFFVAPLFDAKYVARERNAVDAEFRLKLNDDSRREWEVLTEQMNPENPLSWFSVGDLETLADSPEQPLRARLIDFYNRHYTAELMTLVVLGRENLDQLERLVRGRFGEVPGGRGDVAVAKAAVPLVTQRLPRQVFIQPIKEKRELTVMFPVDPLAAHWRSRPDIYWGHLVGDETAGSLLARLKAQGLAEGLSAGLALDSDWGSAFAVSIALTPGGIAKTDQILLDLFAWLNLMREQGLERWRFEELAAIQHTRFRFVEKYEPAAYVSRLSKALRRYPPAEVLRGAYLLDQYDVEVLRQFGQQLAANNALVTLIAPEITAVERTSARYRAPYRAAAVDEAIVETWREAHNATLSLPPVNPYLARAYPLGGKGGGDVAPVKIPFTKPAVLRPDVAGHPAGQEAATDQSGATTEDAVGALAVWHYADQRLGTPLGMFAAKLVTPALNSCRRVARAELYLALVKDYLAASTYQAALAGLDYSLRLSNAGVHLGINGYVDRQSALLDRVLDAMVNADWQPAVFQRLRARLIRDWRNQRKQWPVRQLFAELTPLLKAECHAATLADALETVQLSDMSAFQRTMFAVGHGLFYAGGALSADASKAMAEAVVNALNLGEHGDAEVYDTVVQLANGAHRHSVAVDQPGHSVVLYVQGAKDSLRERARVALLQMIMEAPFYSQLRTEKQLGYVVGSGIRPLHRVPGIVFYVQSPHANPARLQTEIGMFLRGFADTLPNMRADDYGRLRQTLMNNIGETPKNLGEQVGRHLESLYLGYDAFDFRAKLLAEIAQIELAELVAVWPRLFAAERGHLWLATRREGAVGPTLSRADLVAKADRVYAYPE